MAARLRHFAVVVKDLQKAARFYESVFELKRVGEETLDFASAVYLTDGTTVTKSDAGGYAGMADQGDDDKSGFSDAFMLALAPL